MSNRSQILITSVAVQAAGALEEGDYQKYWRLYDHLLACGFPEQRVQRKLSAEGAGIELVPAEATHGYSMLHAIKG